MIGFEKLLVLRDLLDRTYWLLVNNKVLPSGPVPEGKHLLDWIFEHIKSAEIPPEEIDKMRKNTGLYCKRTGTSCRSPSPSSVTLCLSSAWRKPSQS
jgi:hypothetical protein